MTNVCIDGSLSNERGSGSVVTATVSNVGELIGAHSARVYISSPQGGEHGVTDQRAG